MSCVPALENPPERLADMDAARRWFAPLAEAATESAVFAYLAEDLRVLGLRQTGAARVGQLPVSVRDVTRDALAFDARAVVMAHNHPSGDPHPSREDLLLARRLARALDALNVSLVDHLVLAGDQTTSLRALGYL
jgi:DNA repair protein RadC